MCEICYETTNTVSFSPPFCWEQRPGRTERVSSSDIYLGGVREGGREDGLLCFWSKNKKDCKIKYSSEDTISNTALGLLQLPKNQLMFSFVILSFC